MAIYYCIAGILLLANMLPFIHHPHWVFRICDFGRIQVFVLETIVFVIGFLVGYHHYTITFYIIQGLLLLFIIQNAYILIKYTTLYKDRSKIHEHVEKNSKSVSILSVNVYQFNNEYDRLLTLIDKVKPDVVLTMESNKEWENALSALDSDYPYSKKVAQENTYGIHFFSKLDTEEIHVNYHIADDLPSIQAEMKTPDGVAFTLFGIHPPPPSPSEEETSKERDGELLAIAKKARALNCPVVVVGDFNNVAWAKSSVLFRKTSHLIDPRIGRGFVSTFHAKYKLLRFPIDLFFHSTDVFIEEFKTLEPIGSDHLPLFSQFFINAENVEEQEEEVTHLENGEMEEVNEMIHEGEEEESENRDPA